MEHANKLNRETQRQSSLLRQAREALRRSEARYRQLAELSFDAVLAHHYGIISFVNRAGLELLGAKKAEDLVGRRVLDFVHPDSRAAAEGQLQSVSDARQPAPPLEIKLLRLDGEMIEAEVAVDAIVEQGRRSYLVVARDVAARKVAEAQRESQGTEERDAGARTGRHRDHRPGGQSL